MRRTVLALALLIAATVLVVLALPAWPSGTSPVPRPEVRLALVDPYAKPPLEPYSELRDALVSGDVMALRTIASADDSYRAYRATTHLARQAELDASERLAHFERELVLRIHDPLERAALRSLQLEVAAAAEAAGESERAIEAYREALPEAAAVSALARLIDEPYGLANAYFQARQNRLALQALAGRSAPSIEGPAHRALREHERALEAFRRWLAAEPGSREAAEGIAWSLFSLERWDEADAAFAALGGSLGSYGRGLVAGRQGRLVEGVQHLLAAGQARYQWLDNAFWIAHV